MFSKFKIWRFVFFNSKTDAKPFSSFQNLTRHKFFHWKSEKTQNCQFKIWSVIKLKLQFKCVVFFDYKSDELHFPPIQNLTICKILGRKLTRKKFQFRIWRVENFSTQNLTRWFLSIQNVSCCKVFSSKCDT